MIVCALIAILSASFSVFLINTLHRYWKFLIKKRKRMYIIFLIVNVIAFLNSVAYIISNLKNL